MPPPSPPQDNTTAARAAGRGGFAVLFAKVFFILSGLVQQVVLPRLIGLDGYGALSGRVFPVANIINNLMVTASIQGVSRGVAQTPPAQAGQTLRRLFRVHVVIAVLAALGFFFFAPLYARFQFAPHIVRPLQIMSLVVLAYGLYAPLVGALNGQHRFTSQAALDITYAVLRTLGLLGLGYWFARTGSGVVGACIGFALAALIIFPVALRKTGLGEPGNTGPTVKQHLTFILPVAVSQVFLQLLMQSDIGILGRFASLLTLQQGLVGADARQVSDEIVAVYKACQLFAFLPFQLLITLTFIMFPMLAKADAERDTDAVKSVVRNGMRLTFVFACVMVAAVSSLAPHVLSLFFPASVSERGASTLRILALGQGAFAVFYIQTTVLTSLGRQVRSAIFTAFAAGLTATLVWIAASTATTSPALLLYSAIATTVSLSLCAIAVAIAVRSITGAYARLLTIVRVLLTLGVCVAIGAYVPYFGKLMVVPEAIGMVLVAVFLLVITGEVGRDDLSLVRSIVRRSKPA